MLLDDLLNPPQLPGVEAVVGGEPHGVEPELRLVLAGLGVDVRRLLASLLKKKKRYRPTRNTVGIGGLARRLPGVNRPHCTVPGRRDARAVEGKGGLNTAIPSGNGGGSQYGPGSGEYLYRSGRLEPALGSAS